MSLAGSRMLSSCAPHSWGLDALLISISRVWEHSVPLSWLLCMRQLAADVHTPSMMTFLQGVSWALQLHLFAWPYLDRRGYLRLQIQIHGPMMFNSGSALRGDTTSTRFPHPYS